MMKKGSMLGWAFSQIVYLTIPILIIISAFILFGIGWERVKILSEWSFVSIILFFEVTRELAALKDRGLYDNIAYESIKTLSTVFYYLLVYGPLFQLDTMNRKLHG